MVARESEKNAVLERIFDERYDARSGSIGETMVTLDDVARAIRALREAGVIGLSDRNPANFIKDYLRSNNRNDNWPARIRLAGFTARQRTGEGQCFEFVRLPTPDTLPFPDDFVPDGSSVEFVVQTLSLPATTREIVRVDEQSVAQIAVKLQVLEHFLASSKQAVGWGLREITHLQNNVKLRSAEIDALYQAVAHTDQGPEIGAVAVEVKIGDPIIAEQIEKQALAILADRSFAFCIPVILKRFSKGELVAMHLRPLRRQDIGENGSLDLGSVTHSARYVLQPPLPRI